MLLASARPYEAVNLRFMLVLRWGGYNFQHSKQVKMITFWVINFIKDFVFLKNNIMYITYHFIFRVLNYCINSVWNYKVKAPNFLTILLVNLFLTCCLTA